MASCSAVYAALRSRGSVEQTHYLFALSISIHYKVSGLVAVFDPTGAGCIDFVFMECDIQLAQTAQLVARHFGRIFFCEFTRSVEHTRD